MSNPIPLTTDPSNPDSPTGAIPVLLFGAGGGGGGGTIGPIPFTDGVDPSVTSIAVLGRRQGNFVYVQGEFETDGIDGGINLVQLPRGFAPVQGQVPVRLFGARWGDEFWDEGAWAYASNEEQARISVALGSTRGQVTGGYFAGVYWTDDPFPEE